MEQQNVAIVTGGSQGIGAGVVEGYRKLGYAVVATSRTIAPVDEPDLVTVQGDIGDPAVAERIVATAIERFGRIDTLVNNAGIFIAKPFTDYTQDDYAAMLQTNLGGFFQLTRLVVPHMVEQGSGHIVSITTTLVEQASSSIPSVLASITKGGIAAATKSLAIEYAGRGIRVNAVSPGIIRTPLQTEEAYRVLAPLHPLGRVGEVDEVVHGVLYLERASFVTGEFLHVDGGQSAGR
ncbi:SDR family NAD(P)-dependent oxidoreductase [Plantibacter sp. YIM 135347]|uniref:SDR family NAD(P)-dependent oxidoreductase n=1 Tax=Plantibacter sp. YIM 135347 TaxID=3423919 RepID=UPI003D327C96